MMAGVISQASIQVALAHHQAGRFGEAEKLYSQILSQHPNQPDILHLLGVLAGQNFRLEDSIRWISQAIAIDSTVAEFHANLGESYRRIGKAEQAIASLRTAVKLNPSDAVAFSNLGSAFWLAGKFDESIVACRQAIVLDPRNAEAFNNLGNALKEKGEIDASIDACNQAIAFNPNFAEAWSNLGNALGARGDIDGAIAAYRKAIQLNPSLDQAHTNLAMHLRARRQFDEAIESFAKVVQLKPQAAEGYFNLGIALRDKGQIDAAMGAYATAIALNPDYAEAHNNLANAARYLGRLDDAIAGYLKAIECKPDYIEAYNNLGGAYTDQARLDEAVSCFRKALAIQPDAPVVHSNLLFALGFHPDYDARALFKEATDWACIHVGPLAGEITPHANDRDPDRRLKIGYVSPDFRMHAAACFLQPLLANHDPEQVEVFCYASVKTPDAMTQRLRDLSHHWRDTVGLSDADLARLIRHDGIDILIDLTLHMADNRLLTFARKPAPVQITWLGYPGTTGLRAIDYRFTDPFLDPFEQDDGHYSEESIRLPNSFWCYQPMIETPPVNSLPAEQSGFVTFGCLNNFSKVSNRSIHLWAAVLKSIPRSRLIIQSKIASHLEAVLQMFLALGIQPDRVEFAGPQPQEDYFRLYHRIDIGLDPIPYPGHTTTMDALWMGVPVITLPAQTAASRGGVSVLTNAGLKEFIATNPDDYVSIAQNLAGDLAKLAGLRTTLRRRMETSVLTNGQRFAGELESALRAVWKRWCQTPRAKSEAERG